MSCQSYVVLPVPRVMFVCKLIPSLESIELEQTVRGNFTCDIDDMFLTCLFNSRYFQCLCRPSPREGSTSMSIIIWGCATVLGGFELNFLEYGILFREISLDQKLY